MSVSSKLYVGSLPFKTEESELESLFSSYGPVNDVIIVKDRETGRSRGFGFVTFDKTEDAQDAMNALHTSEFGGRNLVVNYANAPNASGRGGSRGGFRGSYGGGGERSYRGGGMRQGGPPRGRFQSRGRGSYGSYNSRGGNYGGGYSGDY